jgi:ubiquinone/menaquinone biosynthesis C-methylase UbiE
MSLNLRKEGERLFDDWPQKYDEWFTTPIGILVKKYEAELLLDLLRPFSGEFILDVGCGTGIFTADILSLGARVVGLDISLPMLRRARQKTKGYPFQTVGGDMMHLPFCDACFEKVISVTSLEFVEDAKNAVSELFRVTQKEGLVMAATLNRLSPWASRRKAEADQGHALFQKAIFRSPDEMRALAPVEGIVRTAIHFQKGENSERAVEIEREGKQKGWETGAFVVACWIKN